MMMSNDMHNTMTEFESPGIHRYRVVFKNEFLLTSPQ
jgi:hypothetical protein